ncbi:hypothetical protein EYF80_049819 [Liparis tanakae]|uniref:Uncharacterized protein n=1 Tax=Liparis tanakae TaxID=230148 RepID=A0A4Z2FGD9_9TELE|nr:hypothetical protein EYF80_049819 [Liparis tanakae]
MRSHAQGRDQHQRVGDAVRRQQQRQPVQDESPQISVGGRGRRADDLPTLGRGRHDEGEQPLAPVDPLPVALHQPVSAPQVEHLGAPDLHPVSGGSHRPGDRLLLVVQETHAVLSACRGRHTAGFIHGNKASPCPSEEPREARRSWKAPGGVNAIQGERGRGFKRGVTHASPPPRSTDSGMRWAEAQQDTSVTPYRLKMSVRLSSCLQLLSSGGEGNASPPRASRRSGEPGDSTSCRRARRPKRPSSVGVTWAGNENDDTFNRAMELHDYY